MPERKTIERARKKAREGKAPTTQAGEFVREEMHHARSGKHPVRSRKQAVAIGLSKARRAGVKLPGRKRKAGGSRRAAARSGTRRAASRTSARKTGARKSSGRKTGGRRSSGTRRTGGRRRSR
jgi:hypothetical protein